MYNAYLMLGVILCIAAIGLVREVIQILKEMKKK